MRPRLAAFLVAGWLAAAAFGAAPDPLLVISIDGFRWDYLDHHPAPHLRHLAAEGVTAHALVPVYPSKTFPNHYTIVTGLHPDRHGIVDNTMADPVLGRFSLGNRDAVGDGRWWGGEPIWVTVERSGLAAATCFWPGSEAAIAGVRPTHWLPYDRDLDGEERVRIVLGWLDLPEDRRPSLITLYWSDVDSAAHDTGTGSAETAAAIERVDRWMGLLLEGLAERGLAERVNLLVVSDHGMVDTPAERTVVLEDFVDLEGVEITGGTPSIFLRPPPERVEPIRRALAAAHPALTVWRREKTPRRWRFRDHPRIPPLIVAMEEGWNVRARHDDSGRPSRPPLAMHGYDPRLPSMHGILIGRGPGLARESRVGRIVNLHLYELMCRLLGVEPAPNEGKLRAVRKLLANRRRGSEGGQRRAVRGRRPLAGSIRGSGSPTAAGPGRRRGGARACRREARAGRGGSAHPRQRPQLGLRPAVPDPLRGQPARCAALLSSGRGQGSWPRDAALRYLIDTVGAENVVLGTDYPADMDIRQPVEYVNWCQILTADEKKSILSDNPMRLLGLGSTLS